MRRIDATQGPILKSILVYTFPLIVSIFIQSLFHTIDIVVLGSMANSGAVAAVGATSSVIALTVNTFFGFSGGAKILMARNIGARNKEAIRNITGTSLLTSVGLGTLIAVLGMIFSIIARVKLRRYLNNYGETRGTATVGKYFSLGGLIGSIVMTVLSVILVAAIVMTVISGVEPDIYYDIYDTLYF
jgi:Na+-driven multidrug efflux pump